MSLAREKALCAHHGDRVFFRVEAHGFDVEGEHVALLGVGRSSEWVICGLFLESNITVFEIEIESMMNYKQTLILVFFLLCFVSILRTQRLVSNVDEWKLATPPSEAICVRTDYNYCPDLTCTLGQGYEDRAESRFANTGNTGCYDCDTGEFGVAWEPTPIGEILMNDAGRAVQCPGRLSWAFEEYFYPDTFCGLECRKCHYNFWNSAYGMVALGISDSDTRGYIGCEPCYNHQYTVYTGSRSHSDCINCPRGKYFHNPETYWWFDAGNDVSVKQDVPCLDCENDNTKCCDVGKYYVPWTLDVTWWQQYSSTKHSHDLTGGGDAAKGCQVCAANTYKDIVGMQACIDCGVGRQTNDGVTGATTEDECIACTEAECPYRYCPAAPWCTCALGQYLSTDDKCIPCEIGTYRDDDSSRYCTSCPSGSSTHSIGSLTISDCILLCPGCPHREYRTGCQYGQEGHCEPCASCAPGQTRVNCRHDAGFNNASGHCEPTELLSYTPFCAEKKEIQITNADGTPINVTQEFASGLGGFSYTELFGVANASYIADFQCREPCVGVRNDTSYCGGPYACNTRVCSASYAQDGEDGYRQDKACPVFVNDYDDVNTKQSKRQVSCVTCDNCGDVQHTAFPDIQDWGRGCANECSRLRCDIGDIFDFTDNKCKTCAQLQSTKLCPSFAQQELRNTDVSGNSVLLRREGCRGRPGQFDMSRFDYYNTETASPDPQYGNCAQCSGIQCAEHEYADTCDTCTACIQHDFRVKEQRLWTKLDGTIEELSCQLQQCPNGRTGVNGDGSLCLDQCMSEEELQCTSSQFVMPCELPHNARCRPRWPAPLTVDAAGEAVDVLVAKRETSSNVDAFGDTLDTASFENVLVEVLEEAQNRHVCVWNAMDIRDSVARPAGISRTWRKPAASIDSVYGKTGTKFCAPIGVFGENDGVSSIAWARDATVQDYPLLPLQNTVTEAATGKAKYVLTNTSASVMHYVSNVSNALHVGNDLYYASVQLPQRPHSFTGDLFLAMDLKSAVRGDVAYQVTLQQKEYSLLFSAWVTILAMDPPVAVHIGVDVMNAHGSLPGTITKGAWLDSMLIESYDTDITPTASGSTSVAVTIRPSVIYDLSVNGGKLYELEGIQNMFFSRHADSNSFSPVSMDGSFATDVNTVQTTMKRHFNRLHGSFVQARAAPCGVLVATEREITCRDITTAAQNAALFTAHEETAIVDFAVIWNAGQVTAGVVLTVARTSQQTHLVSYFPIDTNNENVLLHNIDIEVKKLLTIASNGNMMFIVSMANSNLQMSFFRATEVVDNENNMNYLELESIEHVPQITMSFSSLQSPTGDSMTLDLHMRSCALVGSVSRTALNPLTIGLIAIGITDGLLIVDLHGNTATVSVPTNPVCKPSMEWLTTGIEIQHFLLGLPCHGMLWRGNSSVHSLDIRPVNKPNMLRSAHFLRNHTEWWRIGVFTASETTGLTTGQTESACAEGYDDEGLFNTKVLPTITPSTWPCAWQCTQNVNCRAYNDNGQCQLFFATSMNDLIDENAGDDSLNSLFVLCPKRNIIYPAKTMVLVQTPSDTTTQRYVTTMRSFQVLSSVENFIPTTEDGTYHATALLYLPESYRVREFGILETPATSAEPLEFSISITPTQSFESYGRRYDTIEAALAKHAESSSTTLSFQSLQIVVGLLYHTTPNYYSGSYLSIRRSFWCLQQAQAQARALLSQPRRHQAAARARPPRRQAQAQALLI